MSKKIVKVDEEKCIGCNSCPLIDADTFELDQSTFKAKVKQQPQQITDQINTAVTSCPVGAISIIEQ